MKLQRNRDFRVEQIAAPLPSGLADHGRQMIYSAGCCAQRLIAKRFDDVERTQQVLLRQQQIDVILRPPTRIWNKARTVREALQHHEFNVCAFEWLSDFPISRLDALPSLRVAGKILFQAFAHGVGKTITATKRQRKRELCPIAELQDAVPILIRELGEGFAIGQGEFERSQWRSHVRRKLSRRSRQKSYLSANCMRRGFPAEKALP